MNVALWIVASVVALGTLGPGLMKLALSKEAMAQRGMNLEGIPAASIKGIGVLEVLGGVGLILPALLNIAPILLPIAAVGVAIVMAGAAVFHLRRKELKESLPALVLFAGAVFVAWGRFGAWAF